MAGTVLIRCPVCLRSQALASDFSANKRVYCGNCGRDFVFKNALPVAGYSKPADTSATAAAESGAAIEVQELRSRNPVLTWALGLIFLLVVLKIARPFMATLKGPEFLIFYGFTLAVAVTGVVKLREVWEDSWHVAILGLIFIESMGVLRYIDGSAAGMHKFTIMFFMMGIGGLLMFLRAEHFSGSSSSGGCSDFSSCGSSCSGCGGGGGCGGCGG